MTTHDQQTENAYAPAQVGPTTRETDQLRDRGAPPAAVGGTDTTPKSAETYSGTPTPGKPAPFAGRQAEGFGKLLGPSPCERRLRQVAGGLVGSALGVSPILGIGSLLELLDGLARLAGLFVRTLFGTLPPVPSPASTAVFSAILANGSLLRRRPR